MKKTMISLMLLVYMFTCAANVPEVNPPVRYRTIKVNGLDIFYREAGESGKPVILLLHGFPSSSHMYRDLMNDLSDRYHLIAPDYPGFGQSSAPTPAEYKYTFDNLAATMNAFVDALALKTFSVYVQDYGGPIGFRMATQRPERIQAIIVQNANAYAEGLGDAIKPMREYFNNPTPETEKGARWILSSESTLWQYHEGAEDISRISPDSHQFDQFYLDRPGNDLIQLSLFRDYKSNLALYDTWHAYFRKHQPATLVISGKNDKIFIAQGAEAFKRDIKDAEIRLLNGGHFVLEEKHEEASVLIKEFLNKKGIR